MTGNRINDDGIARNGFTGLAYAGSNAENLNAEQEENEYPSNIWMTWKQARKLGAVVRKGEHGVDLVRYVTKLEKDEATGQNKTNGRSVRNFVVFNIAQIDHLPEVLTVQTSRFDGL